RGSREPTKMGRVSWRATPRSFISAFSPFARSLGIGTIRSLRPLPRRSTCDRGRSNWISVCPVANHTRAPLGNAIIECVEVITSVERRRRWSAAEKARLVAAMDEPGAVVTEIARRAEVNASLLYRWRRELRGAQDRTPAFVPVRVAPEASDAGPASAPA